ncbi:MAG: YebC/PmpR family DNA-binding transcriptional regulator [Rhodospirillales bacterium]|nr:YebC/PmpR family DNA-binding transcriptional regulator [Alphaproteobacteria bacterium]MCB9987401.1 YebC/PmpR family DNA-binding transcriptional regulator [Rhodospirillales bacterium]USO07617.1 MAG: YebC/PmpR family DNA-binding transcriptional regulator [Rhodospirillales bacterium]
MAGHSHAKNVARRKEAQGKKKASLFGKIARGITVAAKGGGPDPDMNPRLRIAIAKAKEVSMPNDRIKRAIEQGLPGAADGKDYQEARYEGYGPGGVAVVVECLTDNVARTVGDVRLAFTKFGGTLGTAGSVSFMFEKLGEIAYPAAAAGADAMFEAGVEAGAQNVESDDEYHSIHTAITDLAAVSEALEGKFGPAAESGLIWKPLNPHPVTALEAAQNLMKLIDALEDNDDVQDVFTNMDLPDDLAAQLG